MPQGDPLPRVEDGYRRKRAWEQAKRAFGSDDVAEQLTRLELCGEGCPRVLLAAAVARFLTLGREGRRRAVRAYLMSLTCPPEEIIPSGDRTPEELEATETEFLAAMARVMGDDPG
jgi:hypothetical protein